jgi:Trk K+ transport system NAD-binding subunit
MGTLDAALVSVCVLKMQGGWPGAYQSFTEVVVFGVIASVVLANVTSKYKPEETCRALAGLASGHVVVVGWTNLGKRVHELARAAEKAVVVVEPDAALVSDLVRDEEPLVVGSPRDRATFESAAIGRAAVVVIAADDLETAAVACRLVREMNGTCTLVVRAADEEVGNVLARSYRARALSTSRLAASFILAHAQKLRARAVVVLGDNNVGKRATEALLARQIPATCAASTLDVSGLVTAGVPSADLVVLAEDDLGDNLIRVERIRSLNRRARILCRAFHEDAAELLTRAPFDCLVLSTSRHAAESLVRDGVFREMGIEETPVRAKQALAFGR